MKGTVTSYRRGHKSQKTHQVLVQAEGVKTRAAAGKLLGKRVVFRTITKRELVGHVTATMGDNGVLRCRFATPLPGQALNHNVTIE